MAPSSNRHQSRSRSRSPRRRRSLHRSSSATSGRSSSRSPIRVSSRTGRSSSPVRNGSSRTSDRSSTAQGRDSEQINVQIDYKAAYLALQASNTAQSQRKRKRDGAEKATSTQCLGRGIRMTAALFGEISTIIADGEEYKIEPYEEVDFDEFADDLTPEQHEFLAAKRDCDRNLGAFQQIHRLVPNMQYRLTHGEPEEVVEFYSGLQKGANDARSEALRRITLAMASWINQDRDRPDIAQFDHTPAITDKDGNEVRQYASQLFDDRGTRGVEHDVCGGLLSTLQHDWKDESVRIGLRSNVVKLNASFYCRIFYQGFKGDPDDVDRGFLKSRYLVKGYKLVFTGPSSAKDDVENLPLEKKSKRSDKAVRKPVCEILHMNGKVTGRSIAFIAVLEHLSLTTARSWTHEYYGFSYPQMYNFLVDYFEAPREGTAERAHVDALLEWWNKQIFPNHASSSSTHHTAVDSLALLRAQRRARLADSDPQ